MSAKGRKRKDAPTTEVAAFEFYPTPPGAILSMIESSTVTLPGGLWLDPCAGTGRIPTTVNSSRSDVSWILVEIDERHRYTLEGIVRPQDTLATFGDFVIREWTHPKADLMIMNPPFSHALDFVRAGFERANSVLMLQRLNWLSPARASWMRDNQPDVFVLPTRPSFSGDGSTDMTEYAWFYWPVSSELRRTGCVSMLSNPRQLALFEAAA